MKQVECDKCGKVFEVEGEWGYCPFCENDNVEVFKNQLLNVQMVSSKEITKLHKELALTEKALELACGTLRYCKSQDEINRLCEEYIYCSKFVNFNQIKKTIDYFKTKAKEMMKSE